MRLKTFISGLFLCFSLASSAFAADALTLDQCIAKAIENHPDLRAAESKIESKKAAVSSAQSSGNPQLNANVNYTRSDGSTQESSSGSYGSGVTLEQSVYDWGKRNLQVKGAKIDVQAASSDYMQAKDQVIYDVRNAYYGLNRAEREYRVAKTRYDNYEKRLVWGKSYYEVGTKAKIEVTKATSDLASSKLALVKAESSAARYKAQLASAMGDPLLKIDKVSDVLDYKEWNITFDEAAEKAAANRPELAAKAKRVEYAKTNLELAKKGLAPNIAASAGYSVSGTSPFEDDGWNAKLSFNVPLSDGGLTKSKTAAAKSDLDAASAEFKSLGNSVILEVRKAWETLREAKESLAASSEAERHQKETLDLAQGRYKAGVGSSLEISDAIESYSSAQANTVLALYECSNARLALEKAMGGLTQ